MDDNEMMDQVIHNPTVELLLEYLAKARNPNIYAAMTAAQKLLSRSKRRPYWVDGYGTNGKTVAKRSASKAVRRSKDIASGSAYKKEFCSWNIADYRFYDSNNSKPWKVRRK